MIDDVCLCCGHQLELDDPGPFCRACDEEDV